MSEVEVDELEVVKKVKLNEEFKIVADSPYISTIRRQMLDFDFEKLCSVSLNNQNVYVCLVCGKYYQGKSRSTHAYTHSLEADHHIFMNLHDSRIYCLPDMYEVVDHSLADIKYNLNPMFTPAQLSLLDNNTEESRALDGTTFLPGYVGLNNLGATDYCNVVIQSLCRVTILRDFMIFYQHKSQSQDPFDYKKLLIQRFSELIRKIWNERNYKGHVSPHELLQAISLKSNKLYRIGKQTDPINLLAWLLDNLKKEFQYVNKKNRVIQDCFEGTLEMEWYSPLKHSVGYENIPRIEYKQFHYLTLDIPSVPLHKEINEKLQIPHIPIQQLLKKFDGQTNKDSADGRRRFKITKFPKYLVVHMKRFVMNNFFLEKNPTIVTFPLNNLDLKQCLNVDDPQIESLNYNLVANVCHEGNAKVGFYKVHIRNKANNQWYQMQDLHRAPIVPQLITISEAYFQIYELSDN